MGQSPSNPERIAEATARRLLERATALETDGPTLIHLRQAAEEAGISSAAFDAAVAEWRAGPPDASRTPAFRPWMGAALRNTVAIGIGWTCVAALAVGQRFLAAPWLVHKLTDPVGLAIGAVIAARLRARTATIILGGLAVSQGAEFLMDLSAGAPAIHGFGAHIALMVAGMGGVAVGRSIWGRPTGSDGGARTASGDAETDTSARKQSRSQPAGLPNADADSRFTEWLRLSWDAHGVRLQLM